MKYLLLLPLFLFTSTYAQETILDRRPEKPILDNIATPPKEDKGSLFYIKAEILQPMVRFAFAPKTINADIQGTLRLFKSLHWVNTYGKTTYYIADFEEAENQAWTKSGLRMGTELHRSSSTLRFFPFNDKLMWTNMLFIEAGYTFSNYEGVTYYKDHDNITNTAKESFLHEINMYRYGPQINIGISPRFEEILNPGKNPIRFSPEVYLGINYHDTKVLKDETTVYRGVNKSTAPYEEPKLKLVLRIKVGIGIN